MKTTFNKVYAILVFLLFIKFENKKIQRVNNKTDYAFENDSLMVYNDCIEELKKTESFSPKIYKCPAGYKTIGYGHRLLKGEHFRRIDSLKAIEILKEDFNKALNLINTKFQDSTYRWKLAHAHFTFCLGFKNAKTAIKNKTLHKYIYYKGNNGYVKAESLMRSRQFELALLNY